MPTYEYRCPKGHEFELFQRMSDEPVASCPTCGKPAQRLLSGGGGLLFKGEGFYITDYRSADYKKKAEAERGGGDKASASGGAQGGAQEGTSKDAAPKGGATGEGAGGSKAPAKGSDA
jgi:putative FmdB family regulatory protein